MIDPMSVLYGYPIYILDRMTFQEICLLMEKALEAKAIKEQCILYSMFKKSYFYIQDHSDQKAMIVNRNVFNSIMDRLSPRVKQGFGCVEV